MRRLQGKVCIVTGAARGIGRAAARAFTAEGAVVYGADCIADELEREMMAIGARPILADLTQAEQIERLVATVMQEQGQVDVLANVAGIIEIKRLEETSLEDFDRILSVNLRGPFLTCRAVAPHMKKAGRGSIINVSSRAGVMGFADQVAYCASKFGLEGLSRAIAEDLGPHGIVVNTITPGVPTRTAMSEKTYGAEARQIWKDPIVIAPAFVYLALQTPQGIHNRHVNAWELSQRLQAEGWEA